MKAYVEQIEMEHVSTVQVAGGEMRREGASRDVAMDFVKGALVLFMVLYHWLNYFIGPSGHYYAYLRFLTPSFIFITGFMISQIHLHRYQNSGRNLAKRLNVRGMKLLAIFLLLNASLIVLISRPSISNGGFRSSLSNLYWSLIGTTPTNIEGVKGASFSMLVPIAYLLILSAGLVAWSKRGRLAFGCTLLLLVTSVSVLYAIGMVSGYLDLLLIGILGVVIGFSSKETLAPVLGHPRILIALYFCYLAVISIWRVILPLQIASVILTTALLYIAGDRRQELGAAGRRIVLLGKYSLFGYIAQIAILQILRRVSRLTWHGVGASGAALVAGVLLTLAAVEIVDMVRKRSGLTDRVYRLIFA